MEASHPGDLRRRDQDELRTERACQRRRKCDGIHGHQFLAFPAARASVKRVMRVRGLEPPRALAHRVLNPARIPVPPHPLVGSRIEPRGYARRMATPEERERESRESDVTKYDELTEEVREEQKEAAERIAEPLEPQDEDES